MPRRSGRRGAPGVRPVKRSARGTAAWARRALRAAPTMRSTRAGGRVSGRAGTVLATTSRTASVSARQAAQVSRCVEAVARSPGESVAVASPIRTSGARWNGPSPSARSAGRRSRQVCESAAATSSTGVRRTCAMASRSSPARPASASARGPSSEAVDRGAASNTARSRSRGHCVSGPRCRRARKPASASVSAASGSGAPASASSAAHSPP
jgi:hypothetical protein